MSKNIRFVFLLSFALGHFSQAQTLVPVNEVQKNQRQQANTKLNLPFFDDFSLSRNTPDSQLWINGGTNVNNTNTNNHPTINVVSFDGRNAQGRAYNTNEAQAFGATDSLTSQTIDLSSYRLADNLFLSFFWQSGGLVENPDANIDSLRLQFRTKTGWKTVKKISESSKGGFLQVFIPLNDAGFLHSDFQFRFESFGTKSGSFDTWHVDYVYLDKNRSTAKIFYKDIAIRKVKNTVFKNYSAMPLHQFLAKPNQLSDNLEIESTNLRNVGDFVANNFYVQDVASKQFLLNKTDNANVYVEGFANTYKVSLAPLTGLNKKTTLKLGYSLKTSDDQRAKGGKDTLEVNTDLNTKINLQRNDSISFQASLDNYFAYDDGTAEYGLQMGTRFGKTLLKFEMNQADYISGVQICFVPFPRKDNNQTQQNVALQIYKDKNGVPDSLLYQQSIPVQYAQQNSFVEYTFKKVPEPNKKDSSVVIAVKDIFYIGWQELSDDPIAVGFDKNNTQFGSKIYYNLGKDWIQNSDKNKEYLAGSLMIRPLMKGQISPNDRIGNTVLVGNEALEMDWILMPNPSGGSLSWTIPNIIALQIRSISGETLISENFTESTQNYQTNLANGLYILQLSDGKQTFAKKIIISK